MTSQSASLDRKLAIVLLLAGLSLQGCADAPTDIDPSGRQARLATVTVPPEYTSEVEPIELYTVALGVVGSLRPGSPLAISYSVNANTVPSTPTVDLLIPELDAARDDRGRLIAGARVPSRSTLTRRIRAGDRLERTATVTFEEPGYYRVLVTARDSAAPDVISGRPVISTAFSELWVRIDSAEGRVTPTFDPTSYASTEVGVAGPRRDRAVRNRTEKSFQQRMNGECDTWHVKWLNPATDQFELLTNVIASGVVTEDYSGNPVAQINQVVSDGNLVVCAAPGTSYSGSIGLADQYVNIQAPAASGYFSGGPSTGAVYDLILNSAAAHVFVQTRATAIAAAATFEQARSVVGVKLESCPSVSNSCYSPSQDRIFIKPGHEFSVFTIAHEFGHAYHHHALGGIYPLFDCPHPHFISQPSSLSCAYVEGIASYVAVAARGSALTIDFSYESNAFLSDPDGSMVEGAVTAFLYDLTDDANSPDQIAGDDETIAFPSFYAGAVLRTCAMDAPFNHANGIDHAVYCFEDQIDPQVRNSSIFFTARQYDPSTHYVTASKPATWSIAAVRGQWLGNLYPTGGSSSGGSSFNIIVSGPTLVQPGASCRYTASDGSTFEWTADGAPTGDGSASIFVMAGQSSFVVAVTAWNSQGQSAWSQLLVQVSPDGDSCQVDT